MTQNKKIIITITTGLLMILAVLFDFDLKETNISGVVEGMMEENIFDNNFENNKKEEIKVVFFDVGQGDSIFIETPEGKQILVDGGDDESVLEKLANEMPLFDNTIELMVLTHPHADHVTGLKEILKRYNVEEVWLTGVISTTPAYLEFLNLINANDIPVRTVWACGNDWQVGCSDEIEFEENVVFKVLNPLYNLQGIKYDNLNNSSIVLKLTFEDNSWLLVSDLEEDQEERILENFSPIELQSEVLKIGHHGSNTSSSQEFLETVNPQYAIISVGADNSFGHPSLRILNRLERNNTEIWRTDEDGTIWTIGDGEEIEIFSEK